MSLRRAKLFKSLPVAGLLTACIAGQVFASPEQDRAAVTVELDFDGARTADTLARH